MKLHFKLWGILLIAVCISSRELRNKFELPRNLKLRMVNAVFRHGDRTPNPLYGETYPNDPFVNETYFPVGYGALTKVGKSRAYALGKFLRKRYNKFLGTTFVYEDITPRSTYINRAKMTLLAVLASLYPPNSIQKWHPSLQWQPVPIVYQPIDKDILLFSRRCPKYKKMFNEIEESEEVQEMFGEFKSLTNELTELTGKIIATPTDVFSFYNLLICQKSMELPIPNWAEELLVNSEFLEAVEVLEKLRNYNSTMRKMNGGRLLKQMTKDMVAKMKGTLKEGRKIKLYSAHDVNVYGQLYALGITKFKNPFYCSAVILELYSDNEDNYYVQVLYYQGETSKVEILKIPHCSSMCEFEKYLELIRNVIPHENELECCDNGLEHCSLQETSFF